MKVLPLDFFGVSLRIPRRKKNTLYCLQISSLTLEIFKFEECVKYANEMTDDIIHSTQYYVMDINRAILANLAIAPVVRRSSRTRLREHRRWSTENWVPSALLPHQSTAPWQAVCLAMQWRCKEKKFVDHRWELNNKLSLAVHVM